MPLSVLLAVRTSLRRTAAAALLACAALLALAVPAPAGASPAGGASSADDARLAADPPAEGTLRVCVLSRDMPLSNEDADGEGREGFYLDVANAMAERLEQRVEVYFTQIAFYKRPVREGLMVGKCDAYFGLPRSEGDWFLRDEVALSQPFTEIGFAVATTDGARIASLEDLKGKTVAVQGGSPAAIAVSLIDDITTSTFRDPKPALEALSAGEVDATFVWGPQTGYFNLTRYDDAFTITPTAMRWPVAIGVRADDRERLIPLFNDLIGQMGDTIEELRAKYGLPTGDTISVRFPGREFTGTAAR